MSEAPNQRVKITSLDTAAAVLASGKAKLLGASQEPDQDLIQFELLLEPGASAVLAEFAAGRLVANVALVCREQRGLRRLLRMTRGGR